MYHDTSHDTILDTIIIGAGLTGCYLLNRLLKREPTTNVLLLEASNRLGGRIETVAFKDVDGTQIQYEAGGARFSDKHKRLVKLLTELSLIDKRVPISSDVMHMQVPPNKLQTRYPDIMKIMKHVKQHIQTHSISDSVIQQHTLYTFISDVMNDSALAEYMLAFYEYYSELATLNMSHAMDVFINEFNDKVQYYVLSSGYESIITALMQDIPTNKYYKLNTFVTHITLSNNTSNTNNIQSHKFNISAINNQNGEQIFYKANNIIVCVPVDALKKIKFGIPNSEKIKMISSQIKPEPLYRIYARFPTPLPENMPKIATNLPIKYIIPMDHKNGVVMLSYTDGIYAKKINKIYQRDLLHDTSKLSTLLTDNFNTLLPYITENKAYQSPFPEPTWIKHHYWSSGAGYWLPGEIPPLSDVIHPLTSIGLYLAGEQLSNHQAWVEGCLETADLVLAKLKGNTNTGNKKMPKHLIIYRTKKVNHAMDSKLKGAGEKTYTKAEVAKHNKPEDAWTIIGGKVYNITKWINKHPGGNVILQGIGRDATALFNNKGGGSGHSAAAHKILSRYYIGELK